MEKAHGTTANMDVAEFGEKMLFQPMTKYNKGNKLDVRWQYGLFFNENERDHGERFRRK